MEYYLIVDGKYFVGETMEEIGGYSKSVSGFFQMGNGGQLTKYEFSADREKASKMILYNVLGYMEGIYERVRYLPNSEKPKKISIVAVGEEETVCHCNVKENAELIAQILDYDINGQIAKRKKAKWTMVDENGCGVCSNCHRQDKIDKLAISCRYCGCEISV